MEPDVMPTQFDAGLHGLGLLRAWPFLDVDSAAARLSDLEHLASDRTHETLDVLDTAEGYAAWSATYDDRVNPLLIAEQPAISALLDGLPTGRALDVACGTGRFTRLLLDHGDDVTGVDPSDAMLSRARSSAPQATYHRASFLRLPFPDASFDIVCCGLALTHVPLLHGAITEMARVLTDGGHLLISDVHPFAVATGAHAFFRHPDGSRGVVRNVLHWHGEYHDAFATAGLRVRRCLEPRFSKKVLDAFTGKGSSPALSHFVGLPYVLIWECVRNAAEAG
jgi:ubiquinone/menaquinone biosynthesis C-methylase UbiE